MQGTTGRSLGAPKQNLLADVLADVLADLPADVLADVLACALADVLALDVLVGGRFWRLSSSRDFL